MRFVTVANMGPTLNFFFLCKIRLPKTVFSDSIGHKTRKDLDILFLTPCSLIILKQTIISNIPRKRLLEGPQPQYF